MFLGGLKQQSMMGATKRLAALKAGELDASTLESSEQSNPRKNIMFRAGFTMIELMVVITIVGILAMSVVSTAGILDADGTDSARKLSANIKYLFDQSGLSSTYIRIYFNFEKNSYEVSASRDRVLLFGQKREVDNGALEESSELKKRKELLEKEAEEASNQQANFDNQSSNLFDETEMDPAFLPVLSVSAMKRYEGAKFDPIGADEDLNFKITLPKGVKLAAVYNDHYSEYVTQGDAEIFIFPNGTIQRSVIVFYEVDNDEYFSLLIDEYSGRGEIVAGYYDLENEPEVTIYEE